jgi:uncharacterized OsmC-like protein
MTDATSIREALERVSRAVTLRPSAGQISAVTRARLGEGLSCEVTDGDWKFTAGVGPSYGGSNAGPTPGVYGRGALASCLAIGYGMWSARLGIPIDSLEVEVQADFDVRGELGVDESIPPGYLTVSYRVTVESSAPESEVMRLLDTADKFSAWRDDYERAIPLKREVRITSSRSA